MRIITGKLKGRKVPVPQTGDLRPTSDRTKEGLFSVIAARRFFEGTVALDLFAGSGNLGFEAISRGTDSVLFVDRNPDHIRQVEKTAEQFGISEQVRTVTIPIEQFLEKPPPAAYDLIFCDPPYDYYFMSEMIECILNNRWLKKEGWFLLEHDKRFNFSDYPHCFFSKPYGRTIVSIFQAEAVDSGTSTA